MAAKSRAEMSLVRREAVMKATSELLDEVGISALTVRQVAERAGVAPGTIFLYAESKADLVNQVYGRRMSEKWHAILDELDDESHLDRVENFYLRCVDLFYEEIKNIRDFYREMATKATVRQENADRLLLRVHQELVDSKANGELQEDVDVDVLELSYQGLYSVVISLADHGVGHPEARETIAKSLRMLRRGVQATA